MDHGDAAWSREEGRRGDVGGMGDGVALVPDCLCWFLGCRGLISFLNFKIDEISK